MNHMVKNSVSPFRKWLNDFSLRPSLKKEDKEKIGWKMSEFL